MARRMIDPQTIIKSQIVDDKSQVDLNEILEKYGNSNEFSKFVTLQLYSKDATDDGGTQIKIDTGYKEYVMTNTAITITKVNDGTVYIKGLIVNNLTDMNLLPYIEISGGDYENGLILLDTYSFDVHVIKV